MSRGVKSDSVETRQVKIQRVAKGESTHVVDFVASEEPLGISINYWEKGRSVQRDLSITMRTPGDDENLAIGFLYSEGFIDSIHSIEKIEAKDNRIHLDLSKEVDLSEKKFKRNFFSTSSCGVCGKAELEALNLSDCRPINDELIVTADVIDCLDEKMFERQNAFSETGGIHACGLFSATGDLISLKEDIGRHNALDKLIGGQISSGAFPFTGKILLLSGRVGYEMAQKSAKAGVSLVVAIGAPSSLAVEILDTFGITLVGFLRPNQFNIYTHPKRIAG